MAYVGFVESCVNQYSSVLSLPITCFSVAPVACVLQKVNKRKGSVVLQGDSSTAEVALLSLSCEISPYQSPASVSLSS